jgi:acetylornithine deacetylase/succinyl-diaminopimelate desuccinylase-like protein
MTVETMNRDTHSGSAHIFPNAVWRLVWALQSLKNKDERLLIDGWYDDARPPSERDLEYLEQMPLMEATYRETVGVTRFAAGRTGDELRRTVFEPTCNIQGIDGGYQGEGSKTITPARARAKLDFRLVPDQDPRRCFDLLGAHLDAHGFEDIELAWLGAMSPSRTDPDDPLVRLTNDAALDVYGKPASVVPLNGGSSPQYAFKDPLGIPIVRAGVGYWDSRTHAPNEHVRLEDFLKAAKHIARIVEGFADL